MPMSDYIRGLRDKIGTAVLEVPTVGIVTLDESGKVLLVRHIEGNDWSTPGGMIEPYESPSNAAVREMWEETGLFVELTHVIGVFGGELCASTYSNGDKMAWVATLFGARPIRGTLKPDGIETIEVRYFGRHEISGIRCKPHVRLFLGAAWSLERRTYFQPPTWEPASG
jgi:8-oxo-dGTP pyrophosphatase MutT (NUDIX family)